MKMVSWNVNGLRAIVKKGFEDIFSDFDADFFCLQEIKLQEGQIDLEFDEYYSYWNYAEKKGYSGTAIYTKHKPLNVYYGLDIEKHDLEGRLITLEYEDYYFLTCYTPNAQGELKRLDYRLEWENDFRDYLNRLSKEKSVILCGDLNVAHQEIDLKNPNQNRQNPGFSIEEREAFSELIENGFIDTFRFFYPNLEEVYSWWSYRYGARKRNAGWRIDYFVTSKDLSSRLNDAVIHTDIMGSDHCPVELTLKTI